MLSNPIVQDAYTRTRHIVLCALLSTVYALVYGWMSALTPLGIATDALITATVMFAEDILLWSIFTYSRLEALETYISISVQIIYILIAIGLQIGLESLVACLAFSDTWPSFAAAWPGRVFSLTLIYCFFRLYFLYDQAEEPEDQQEEIEEHLEATPSEPAEIIKRITVKTGQKIKVIPVEDLLYLEAEDDYVSVVTAEGHWLKSERLKDFESSLPANVFARVHRSYIVNMSKISKIERYGQKQMLTLTNGKQIKISMTGYKVLKEKLNL